MNGLTKDTESKAFSTVWQIDQTRLLFLCFYSGTSFLTIFVMHAAAGQYFKEMGLPFSFEWTIEDGIVVGACFGTLVSLLTWWSIRICERKSRNSSPITCSTINGSLVLIFFVLAQPYTPGWTDHAFVGEIIIIGLVLSASTYLYLNLRKPGPYQSKEAMTLQHARSLQNLRDIIWAFVFITASIVFYYLIAFIDEVPGNLRYSSTCQTLISIHIAGMIYLLAGILVNIVDSYRQYVKRIEQRIDRIAKDRA